MSHDARISTWLSPTTGEAVGNEMFIDGPSNKALRNYWSKLCYGSHQIPIMEILNFSRIQESINHKKTKETMSRFQRSFISEKLGLPEMHINLVR